MKLELVKLFDGASTFRDGAGKEYLHLDLGCGTLITAYVNGIPSPLDSEVPTFWSTAPTHITAELGVAVNAKFDLDPGRSYLIDLKTSEANRGLVRDLSLGLYSVLMNSLAWERFLGERDDVEANRYAFYNGLWTVFANLRSVGKWSGGESGVAVLKAIIWGCGDELSGYRRFIEENPVVPSGLSGELQKLYKLSEVECVIPGDMQSAALCREALRWSREDEGVVSSSAFAINDILNLRQVALLDWERVFKVVLEAYPSLTPQVANGSVGQAISEAARFLDLKKEAGLKELLRTFTFTPRAGNSRSARELLSTAGLSREDDIEVEKRKIAFAPDDVVLSNDYNEVGQTVYRFCRSVDRDGIKQDVLADIAYKQVINGGAETLRAVLSYVCVPGCGGEFCQVFREKCGEAWCENLLTDPTFLSFGDNDKLTIAGRLKLPVEWPRVIEQPELPNLEPVPELPEKDQLLQGLDDPESCPEYSKTWLRALLRLEIIENKEDVVNDHPEVTVQFRSVRKANEGTRTLVLGRSDKPIPGWFANEQNQPLILTRSDGTSVTTVIEDMSIKGFELEARIAVTQRFRDCFPDWSFSGVMAKTSATRPGFLLAELESRYKQLGFEGPDDIRNELPPADRVSFIFGPPGTGKTTRLGERILDLVNEGGAKHVLVLTPTNRAADEVASSVIRRAENQGVDYLPWLTRFGLFEDDGLQARGVARGKNVRVDDGCPVVVITTIVRLAYDQFNVVDGDGNQVGKPVSLREWNWDVVIMDEASMIPIHQVVYPFFKLKNARFLIAGDPKQIMPVVKSKRLENLNVYTLVGLDDFAQERTRVKDYSVERLMEQHRSVEAIGEVVSRFSYGGMVSTAQNLCGIGTDLHIDGLPTLKPLTVMKFKVERWEGVYKVKRVQGSPYHVYSALFVFEFVRELVRKLNGNTDVSGIGIVSPYRVQANLINRLLDKDGILNHAGGLDIAVNTAHGFQGGERDMIIAVLNPTEGSSERAYVNNQNILNVAISRAKKYLIVVLPESDRPSRLNSIVNLMATVGCAHDEFCEYKMSELEQEIWHIDQYIDKNTYQTGHQSVNVYALPEKRFEVRSEDKALDIQFRPELVADEVEDGHDPDGQAEVDGLPEVEGPEQRRDRVMAEFKVPDHFVDCREADSKPDYVPSQKSYYQYNEETGAVERLYCEVETQVEFNMENVWAIEI